MTTVALDLTPERPRSAPTAPDAIDTRLAFAGAVAAGLAAVPRRLDCRWLYDAAGSALFERITTLPEYYLTRVEARLLSHSASRLRDVVGPQTLVELGCGSAVKTRHLLRAWCAADGAARYVGVDVSPTALTAARATLAVDVPRADVATWCATWDLALPRLRTLAPACVLLLGSSLGNLDEPATERLFGDVAAALPAGSHFLVGVDLAKDAGVLEPAYDDAHGVTAAFTRNLFARMNRELGTTIPLDAVEHVARWNAEASRVEIDARFGRAVTIALPELDRRFRIAAGESVRVEISRKFDADALAGVAAGHGFRLVDTVLDARWRYALLLFRRAATVGSGGARRRLDELLRAVRARTLAIIEPLDDVALRTPPSDVMGPIAWDLGHIANFAERWASLAHGGGRDDAHAARSDRFYDPTQHPRAARRRLALPDRDALRDALARSLAHVRGLLAAADVDVDAADPLRADGHVFALLAQHEAQHAETMLQAVQSLGVSYEPLGRLAPPIAVVPATPVRLTVPAGTFTMGTDDRRIAYDNERPAHPVHLGRYRIDRFPVTNAQFLAFVADDGYRRDALWSAAGWAWRAAVDARHPAHWVPVDDGWDETCFGRRGPLVPDRPVMHVSWYEADAYARWAGARLPTEAEWEKAAAWDPERPGGRRHPWGDAAPTPALANLDARTCGPSACGAHPDGRSWIGCEQMLGSVWEWTASDFAPYPGFVAFPYPEYSAVHFGRGYKVLRGGSWATQAVAIRNTFRNWDLPERRQIFAGFRCADDG